MESDTHPLFLRQIAGWIEGWNNLQGNTKNTLPSVLRTIACSIEEMQEINEIYNTALQEIAFKSTMPIITAQKALEEAKNV